MSLEPVPRCSKLAGVDVKADAELVIAPYKAELSKISMIPYVQRRLSLTCYSMDAPIERLSRAIKETSSWSLRTSMIGAVSQARAARAVQSGNKMGGAVEDDWVDVGQIGAA
jgi:hypothetical protein